MDLAEVLVIARRPLEAIAEYRKVAAPRLAAAGLGYAYAMAGQKSDALTVLASLKRDAHTRYVCPCDFALVHVGLGDHRRALDWLERGLAGRAARMILLSLDPRFAPLRRTARFQRLLGALGLPQVE